MTTSRRHTIMLWMAYTEFFYPGCELQPGYFYLSMPELYYIPEDGACIGAAGIDAYDEISRCPVYCTPCDVFLEHSKKYTKGGTTDGQI